MSSRPRFAASSASSSASIAAVSPEHLDAELARWLRLRTEQRTRFDREESPLDGVAMALRRVRSTLAVLATYGDQDDAAVVALVSRGYRWAIRIARELEGIERLALDPMTEWTRFEAFAPFAVAFFESVLAGPFATVRKTPEIARLEREIGAVLAPLTLAMRSSAMAA